MTYKQQKFIFHSSGDWKCEIRVPAWLGSGEGPLQGCTNLTSHFVLMWWQEGESSWVPFMQSLISLMIAAPSSALTYWDHHLGGMPGFQYMNLGVIYIQSIAVLNKVSLSMMERVGTIPLYGTLEHHQRNHTNAITTAVISRVLREKYILEDTCCEGQGRFPWGVDTCCALERASGTR